MTILPHPLQRQHQKGLVPKIFLKRLIDLIIMFSHFNDNVWFIQAKLYKIEYMNYMHYQLQTLTPKRSFNTELLNPLSPSISLSSITALDGNPRVKPARTALILATRADRKTTQSRCGPLSSAITAFHDFQGEGDSTNSVPLNNSGALSFNPSIADSDILSRIYFCGDGRVS